jgi:hypothetical protein
MVLNGLMNLGASMPRTLKHHEPLMGDALRYMKSPTQNLILFTYYRHSSSVSTVQSSGTLSLYELVSWLLAICRVHEF